MQVEKQYDQVRLSEILKQIGISPEEKEIEDGLWYFRKCFESRPNRYPGDPVYYDLFCRAILSGLLFQDAYKKVISVIDREMSFLDYLRPVYGYNVHARFDLEKFSL